MPNLDTSLPLTEDPFLGPAAPDLGWVPAPRYLLRRRRILRQLRDTPASETLEIGSGAGMLLQELAARGHRCHALETSPQARGLMAELCARSGLDIRIHPSPSGSWKGRFPLVMAFEVLEHIEDDTAALSQWADWLAPGGTLLLSVPAHPWQWNAADVWAGHFRRYTRRNLLDLIHSSGLEIGHAEYIGFPLGNLTEFIQALGVARQMPSRGDEGTRRANNDRSGIDRHGLVKWFPGMKSWPGKAALATAFAMQAATSRLPLGNGLLIRADKPR